MILADDALYIHDIHFIGTNAGIEHAESDDAICQFKVHDKKYCIDDYECGFEPRILLQVEPVV